jgi:hypothetical protein
VAALIIGNSNSGKSTLTTRLASEGWGYLSDDMVLLKDNREKIEARGLRRNFTISPFVLERMKIPRLKEALGQQLLSDSAKRYLDPSLAFPNSFIELGVPRALLFPVITNEASTRMEKLSQSNAMMTLVTYCVWARFDRIIAHDYLKVLAGLVKQSCSWALYAGLDLIENPGCAASLLSDHIAKEVSND